MSTTVEPSSRVVKQKKTGGHSELHTVRRFDTFYQPRVEPAHYPNSINSIYKKDYLGKSVSGKEELLGDPFPKYYKNPLVGLAFPKPELQKETLNQKEFSKKSVKPDTWALANRLSAAVDHLQGPSSKGSAWKVSTEYRDATNPEGKTVVDPVLAPKLPAPVRPPVEKASVYAKDFTDKKSARDFFDPRTSAEDNMRVVRSMFSTNHLGACGQGVAHPTKDNTLYRQDFSGKAPIPDGSRDQPIAGDPKFVGKPSALANWRVVRGQIQGATTYKKDFVDQQVRYAYGNDTTSVASSRAA